MDTFLKAYLDPCDERLVQLQFQQIPDLEKFSSLVREEILSREKQFFEWIHSLMEGISERMPILSNFIANSDKLKEAFYGLTDREDPDFTWRLLFTNDVIEAIAKADLSELESKLIDDWRGSFKVLHGLFADRENARDLLQKMPQSTPKQKIPEQIQIIAKSIHVRPFGDRFQVVTALRRVLEVLIDEGNDMDLIPWEMVQEWIKQKDDGTKNYTKKTIKKELTNARRR